MDKYHVGGLFFDRGCGLEFSEYMKTWAGCVAAITALYAALQVRVLRKKPFLSSSFFQISGVFLCHFMIKFKRDARQQQQSGAEYEMKPLPAEPDVIPRLECCQQN